jgi:hypothetical protein
LFAQVSLIFDQNHIMTEGWEVMLCKVMVMVMVMVVMMMMQ